MSDAKKIMDTIKEKEIQFHRNEIVNSGARHQIPMRRAPIFPSTPLPRREHQPGNKMLQENAKKPHF